MKAAPIIFTDADRAEIAEDCAAFRRGVSASIRALERQTPLAKGSIAALQQLLEACSPRTVTNIHKLAEDRTGRVEVSADHPLAKALRPSRECMDILDRMDRLNAEAKHALRDFIVGSAPEKK